MAIHAHSTPAPARPLLPEALPSGGLLPERRAELLAILEDAPSARSWGFVTRPQRKAIQAGVDALIAYLDAIDTDCDLEDGGDTEPNCGGDRYSSAASDECEPDDEGDPLDAGEEVNEDGGDILDVPHDEDDDEHSLGAPENPHDQRRWAQGRYSQELDHDEHTMLRSRYFTGAGRRVAEVRQETERQIWHRRQAKGFVPYSIDGIRVVGVVG